MSRNALWQARALQRAAEERAWQLDVEHYDRFTRKSLLPPCGPVACWVTV